MQASLQLTTQTPAGPFASQLCPSHRTGFAEDKVLEGALALETLQAKATKKEVNIVPIPTTSPLLPHYKFRVQPTLLNLCG